jgi:hypothetical protein
MEKKMGEIINSDVVHNPIALEKVLRSLQTDISSLKTAMDSGDTAVEELIDDHATEKTSADAVETLIEELSADHAVNVTWSTEVDSDLDDINDYHDFLEADGCRGGTFTVATQADVTVLGAGIVPYVIDGIQYYASTAGNITLAQPSTNTIADTKFGAWRIVIDRLGAITTQAANASTMQFDSAEIALLNLSAIAQTANTACLGYIVIENTSGGAAFTIGTTNTNTTTTGTYYYERFPRKQCAGLTAALGASLAIGGTNTNYSTGTRDYKVSGVNVAQDAAEADKTFNDADTIGQSQYGGHLIVTNLGNSATVSLAADGIAGSVSAMTYASSAAVDTAIDTVCDNLPSMFAPVGKIVVTNNVAGAFTYGTDDIAGTDGSAVYTDCTVGVWDRTSNTGFDSHKINPPAIPASVTAPLVATLTSPNPASGPATLSSSDPTDVGTLSTTQT